MRNMSGRSSVTRVWKISWRRKHKIAFCGNSKGAERPQICGYRPSAATDHARKPTEIWFGGAAWKEAQCRRRKSVSRPCRWRRDGLRSVSLGWRRRSSAGEMSTRQAMLLAFAAYSKPPSPTSSGCRYKSRLPKLKTRPQTEHAFIPAAGPSVDPAEISLPGAQPARHNRLVIRCGNSLDSAHVRQAW